MKDAVLVTGASGFLGRHLAEALISSGYQVERHTHEDGDIACDPLNYGPVSHVFHLAGKSLVAESWQDPSQYYRVNVLGTANVLEFCRRRCSALIFVSSYVYGTPQQLPIDEKHPVAPHNPYCHSKILAEDVARFYAAQFGLAATIVRPFNIYGPGQKSEFLIPTIALQMLADHENRIVVQDGRPKRDYIFVSDFIDLLMAVLKRSPPPSGVDVFNAGSGKSVSIANLAAEMAAIIGVEKEVVSVGIARPGEILDVQAAIGKATLELGWIPKTSLRDGLRKVLNSLTAGQAAL